MKRLLVVAAIIAFSVTYSYGQMHECGHMMGQGYGGHMMGPGGHMGCGEHMMGPGGHMGCGEHMMGDMLGYGSEEEQQKFLDDTTDLRREMHNKKFDYSEALRNPDTKRTTLLKLRKEMLEIKIKMYERAIKIN